MNPLGMSDAFQTYAICAAILVIKMFLSATWTGMQRRSAQGYVNPEDAAFVGKEGTQSSEQEAPAVARALRIQRNDLENIPAFWIIGLLYVLSGASAFGAAIYFWTFTLARIAHTLVYIRHMQPVRAILWFIGVACIVGMGVQVIAAGLM